MFDEFNSDEKCTKDKISELRLKHSTTRDTKKVASMDKILFDIKKKIETEEYIRKHSTDDASSILSETGASDLKKPDSVESGNPTADLASPKPAAAESLLPETSKPSSPLASEVKTLEEKPAVPEPSPRDLDSQPPDQQSEKAAEEMAVDSYVPPVEPFPEPVAVAESVEQPVHQAQEPIVEQKVDSYESKPVETSYCCCCATT